jgi:protein AroM
MKIGIVTIGQSPRPDVVGEITRVLGSSHEVVEAGALDGLTLEELSGMRPARGNDILVTRTRDGTEVKVTHDLVCPLIQERITELDDRGVGIILLLCTGKFPKFEAKSLIVTPSEIVRGCTAAAIREGRLGMIYPSIQQVGGKPAERQDGNLITYLDAASPYEPMEEIEKLGDRLAKRDLDLIVLNCMGFSHEHKRVVKEKTGKTVIQSSSLVGRVLKELVS